MEVRQWRAMISLLRVGSKGRGGLIYEEFLTFKAGLRSAESVKKY